MYKMWVLSKMREEASSFHDEKAHKGGLLWLI